MFELSHLRCFVAVAEELHFGRAAERLHMTQPPVSRQIMQLEQTLGVSLLTRSNRVVALTAPGRSFLKDARDILHMSEEAQHSVRQVAAGEKGTLAIGFIPASSYELLPQIVSLTSERMPGIEIILKELVTAAQLDRLSTRRIDVGILRLPVDRERVDTLCIARDRMMLAVPKGHPLEALERVPLARIDRQPFIMYAPVESRYHHDLVSAAFRRADVRPDFVQYARETHTILSLAGAGVGLAIVPESATRLRPATVQVRELDLTEDIVSQIWLAWLRENDNPALVSFLQLVHDYSLLS